MMTSDSCSGQCPAGYACTEASTSPVACPAGRYSVAGSWSCTDCPPGRYDLAVDSWGRLDVPFALLYRQLRSAASLFAGTAAASRGRRTAPGRAIQVHLCTRSPCCAAMGCPRCCDEEACVSSCLRQGGTVRTQPSPHPPAPVIAHQATCVRLALEPALSTPVQPDSSPTIPARLHAYHALVVCNCHLRAVAAILAAVEPRCS
jgi:hypothetical protein